MVVLYNEGMIVLLLNYSNCDYVYLFGVIGFVIDQKILLVSYFYSFLFFGMIIVIGLGLIVVVGGFGFVVLNLILINVDIGLFESIVWVFLVYMLIFVIGFFLVGRLSDFFGRCVRGF